MLNVTLKGLRAGNADLYYAARVEPYRQRLIPRPTPLSTRRSARREKPPSI
jgi:hypothetical protein